MAENAGHESEATHVLVVGTDTGVFDEIARLLREVAGPRVQVDHAATGSVGLQALLVGPYDMAFVLTRRAELQTHAFVLECTARGILAPLVCLIEDGVAAHRMSDRTRAIKAGAIDSVIREDLSGPLLEAVLFNAIERRRLARRVQEIEVGKELREQEFRESRRLDTLTDLPSRALFMDRLTKSVNRAAAEADYTFAALLIDVDRFGLLNEGIGREPADKVLTLLARRIESCVGPEDLVARFGGDKFAILLEHADDATDATRVADGIHRSLKEPFAIDGQPVYTNVNIGMTSSSRNYERAEDVINDVSAAAGRAKHHGERREVFKTSMRVEAIARVRLEAAMRQAVGRDEFILHYQPIIGLGDGKLVGFEALIRWHHPGRGLIPPAEFIPVAESTGLIVPIGRWVLREAASQLRSWNDEFGLDGQLSVAVNLSARQIEDARLLEDLTDVLSTSGLDAGALKLELTESVLLEKEALVSRFLATVKKSGIRIYVDDFGTGYSSLSYLHRFPVDGLKIDKSFVDVVDETEQGEAMVKGIMSLAQSFGVDVIAEGIERREQADRLLDLGCGTGQGYLFARPLSTGDAYAYLARGAGRS
jgi:diguanylate cyclase (GGDEF)-like protein